MKVHTKLGIGFSSLIVWLFLIVLIGINENKLFYAETNIDELVNDNLIKAQNVQVNVLHYLMFDEMMYIEDSFTKIDEVLLLVKETKNQMKDLSNQILASDLEKSFNTSRNICSEFLQNQEQIRIEIDRYKVSSQEVQEKFNTMIEYSNDYVLSSMGSENDHKKTFSLVYLLEDLKKNGDRYKSINPTISLQGLNKDRALLSHNRKVLLELTESIKVITDETTDNQLRTLANELQESLSNSKTAFSSYENIIYKESELVSTLNKETKNSIYIIRQLHTGVTSFIKQKINLNRNLIIIFACLSIILSLMVSFLLIRDISRTLGAEPFQLDLITKKIAARDFDIAYPKKNPTGVLSSIKHMSEDLKLTTASLADLKNEILLKEKTQEDLKDILDSMSEGFALHEIILDDNDNPVDYRFKYVNPSYERILGIKSENLIGKTVMEVFPQTEKKWIDKFGSVALTGIPLNFKDPWAVSNRYYNISTYSPEHGVFAAYLLDITDQINAVNAIEEKSNFLSITLKSIGDGVISTDSEGKITFINPVTESLTEWSNDDAYGKPLDQVFHIVNEYTNEKCENPAQKVLETGQIIELANHTTLISKNNIRHIIEDSAAPIIDHCGVIQGVIIVFRDTTEKSRMKDIINQNQKLESLSFLAGGIAHDFNNYLAGIFGYVELVKNRLTSDKQIKEVEYLKKILDISENAKALTQQLLTFAKGDNTTRKVICIKDIIHTSLNFSLRGTNVTSMVEIDDDLWNCYCDSNRISQCLDNLIINGIQSMPEGGELSFTAKNAETIPRQLNPGRYIELKISDSGCGIPDRLKNKIFDPFFTTKEKGSGLGLATVFSIIQNHDGIIEVESKEGVGTSFFLYLPATESVVENEFNALENKTSGDGYILILDDQEYITEVLNDLLESLGFKTYIATKSQDAINILDHDRNGPKNIKACILDQTLPGDAKGHEIAAKMKRIDSDIILFASSGFTENDVMQNPKAYNFEDCIKKPFDMKQISNLMNRYLS